MKYRYLSFLFVYSICCIEASHLYATALGVVDEERESLLRYRPVDGSKIRVIEERDIGLQVQQLSSGKDELENGYLSRCNTGDVPSNLNYFRYIRRLIKHKSIFSRRTLEGKVEDHFKVHFDEDTLPIFTTAYEWLLEEGYIAKYEAKVQ